MSTKRFFAVAALAITFGWALAGCPDEETSAPIEGLDDAIGEACEHLAAGPPTAITATADAASAPGGYHAHKRVEVTLQDDGDGGYSGWVKLNIPTAGEAAFVLDSDVILQLTAPDQSLVTAKSSQQYPAACNTSPRTTVFDVEVGKYDMKIRALAGTTDGPLVKYVVEIFPTAAQ